MTRHFLLLLKPSTSRWPIAPFAKRYIQYIDTTKRCCTWYDLFLECHRNLLYLLRSVAACMRLCVSMILRVFPQDRVFSPDDALDFLERLGCSSLQHSIPLPESSISFASLAVQNSQSCNCQNLSSLNSVAVPQIQTASSQSWSAVWVLLRHCKKTLCIQNQVAWGWRSTVSQFLRLGLSPL